MVDITGHLPVDFQLSWKGGIKDASGYHLQLASRNLGSNTCTYGTTDLPGYLRGLLNNRHSWK